MSLHGHRGAMFRELVLQFLRDHGPLTNRELADLAREETRDGLRLGGWDVGPQMLRLEKEGRVHRSQVVPNGKITWSDAAPAIPDGSYRCVECGHGRCIKAWATVLAEGTVTPGGNDLTGYDYDEVAVIEESSLRCTEHGDTATIEKRIDGEWCRWVVCETCGGEGRVMGSGYYGTKRDCPACHFAGGEWCEIEEDLAGTTAKRSCSEGSGS